MPKIINEYAASNPLVDALQGFAGSFGGNTPQLEAYRQKAKGLLRENANIPLLADAITAGDYANAARYGILSDKDPKFTGGYGQFVNVNRYGPASREATTATMAVPGANYGNTVQGTNAEMANRRGIAQMTTDRTLAQQQRQFDNTFETVMNPDTRQPELVPRSQAAGRQPFLPLSQVQGGILQQAVPELTPDQRAAAGGYAPKNPANAWTYQTPDGRQGTTVDARTDAQSGAPLPTGTKTMKMEGANTEGLSGNNTVDKSLLESRVATEQTKALITQVRNSLAQPNAAQAIGYVGAGASVFNNLRAQLDAVVMLAGGTNSQQELASPAIQQAIGQATNTIFGNAAWNARAQQLGIDANKMRSQVQDLAYSIAKAQDPGGRISVDDIRRAAETIGASLMDPRAADAVLADLAQRVETNQSVRERVTKQMYPKVQSQAVQPSVAPQQQPSVEQWERDPSTGALRRVQ